MGYRTEANEYAGGKIEAEVRNPEVDHTSTTEFLVSRVLTQTTLDEWIEVGWGEHSSRPSDQEVYTYSSESSIWGWFGGYNLVQGSFYAFRSSRCSFSGVNYQCAAIYWSGEWQLLSSSEKADCRGAQGNARCDVEEFAEVFSNQQDDPHPNLTTNEGGNRLDFRETELRNDAGNWITWTRPSNKATPTAYDTCPISNYYRFYGFKGSC